MPFAYPNLLANVFDKLTQIKSKALQANKRPEHLTWLQNENVFLREALESLTPLIDEVTGREGGRDGGGREREGEKLSFV